MNYSFFIQKLFQINLTGGVKFGLQNIEQLQQLLDFPDRHFRSIHVAGTNGKGSVCIKIASALQKAGYRVGLYTSPHISSFRERIRVNGEMISEESAGYLLSKLFDLTEKANIPATFFEITTLLAFQYFKEAQVGVAVIETGLGGRLDATNIIVPCLSVITSIDLDHTEILGNTIDEIANEKGGIIKDSVPVIIGPRVPMSVVQSIAAQRNTSCIQVKETPLLFENENRLIAKCALNFLRPRFALSDDAIETGLDAKQQCRFQVLPGNPVTILDVAHNPDGFRRLFAAVRQQWQGPVRLVMGLSANKDIAACLDIAVKEAKHFHLVAASNGRGASVSVLSTLLDERRVSKEVIFEHDSLKEAIQVSKNEAIINDEIVVVCGSFFIMAEARDAVGIKEPRDEIDMNERTIVKTDR